MNLKISPGQAKQVYRLVRDLCCNCVDGNCQLLDDGESHQCVQLISIYKIYCKYFFNAVLPADNELYKKIIDNQI